MKDIIAVDANTGQVIDDGITIISHDCIRSTKRQPIYTDFYWILYHASHSLLDDTISGSNLTRYLFLCTYIGHDNRLYHNRNHPMKKEDLPDVLELSRSMTASLLAECMEKKLLTIDLDDTITISSQYIRIGKLPQRILRSGADITRVFKKAVRELYRKSDARAHKTLAYLFALLPHCNVAYNIICANPLQKDKELIEPLSWAAIADLIGYQRSNACKLKHILLDLDIDGIAAVKTVTSKYHEQIYINPDIFYAGDKADEVNILCCFDRQTES